MHYLRVHLFGAFQVNCDCGAENLALRPSARLLLAYLLAHGQATYRRDQLAAVFWGDLDEQQARRHLRQALWRLHSALAAHEPGPAGMLFLATSEEVGLNLRGQWWLDVAAFEATAASCLARNAAELGPAEVAGLEEALALYRGDFLEGYYDDWVIRARERLVMLYLGSLAQLGRIYRQQSNFQKAIACGRQILAVDPLREDVHRELMRLYLRSHQRALAIRQFEECRTILAQELGLGPMPETIALYSRIAGRGLARAEEQPAKARTLAQVLRQFDAVVGELDAAREQLRQALTSLTRLGQKNE